MDKNPVLTLRAALQQLLDEGAFDYTQGNTRLLVAQAMRALQKTAPAVAHERAVGIFRYDPSQGAFLPVDEELAKDMKGELRPGFEYLFRNPVTAKAH